MQANVISTAAQAVAAKPGVHRIGGATGLYLKKGKNGSGSWFWRYRLGDKRPEMGLGSLREVSLADARKQVVELSAQRNKGVDPIAARRQERAANLAKALNRAPVTFREAAEAYCDEHAPAWKHRYARANWLNPIAKYAFPAIGGLALDSIEIEHIRVVIRAASKVPSTARTVRQRIEVILDDAAAKGQRSVTARNPAEAKFHRAARRKPGDKPHYRRLELDDAPAMLRALKTLSARSTALSAWVFMIAAAVRPSEALRARWDEIDLDRKLWTIPASRMKSNRKHVVPLSSLALAALERQRSVRAGDAVFPSPRGGILSYNSFAKAPAKASVDAGTPHSWRSIFRDACGDRLRVDRDLAEAALSHTLGAVEGAYRRETAIEARRPVMEAYANRLLSEGTEVIAFPAIRSLRDSPRRG